MCCKREPNGIEEGQEEGWEWVEDRIVEWVEDRVVEEVEERVEDRLEDSRWQCIRHRFKKGLKEQKTGKKKG